MNQLLLGKKVKELPPVARTFLEDNGLVASYDKALKVKRLVVTPVEKMFINMIRTPDYAFNIPDSKKVPLSLEQVVRIVRENNYAPDTCAHWAVYLISEIDRSYTGKDFIEDSVLYLSEQTDASGVNLEDAVKRAFAIHCWGVLNPNERVMKAFNEIYTFVTLPGEMSITVPKFEGMLKSMVTAQVSPRDIGEYSLIIPDYAVTLAATKGLCGWGNIARTLVRVVVRRGNANNTIVAGIMPMEDFMVIMSENEDALVNAHAQGSEIVFGAAKGA